MQTPPRHAYKLVRRVRLLRLARDTGERRLLILLETLRAGMTALRQTPPIRRLRGGQIASTGHVTILVALSLRHLPFILIEPARHGDLCILRDELRFRLVRRGERILGIY
jgi:hypothetical protein